MKVTWIWEKTNNAHYFSDASSSSSPPALPSSSLFTHCYRVLISSPPLHSVIHFRYFILRCFSFSRQSSGTNVFTRGLISISLSLSSSSSFFAFNSSCNLLLRTATTSTSYWNEIHEEQSILRWPLATINCSCIDASTNKPQVIFLYPSPHPTQHSWEKSVTDTSHHLKAQIKWYSFNCQSNRSHVNKITRKWIMKLERVIRHLTPVSWSTCTFHSSSPIRCNYLFCFKGKSKETKTKMSTCRVYLFVF